jgi:hypothetical protein
MKSKGVFWGVLLIAVGLLFVLRNLGYFYFSWRSFWHLWPVILLVLGISLLPVKGFIRIIIAFVVIAVSVIFLTDEKYDSSSRWDEPWNWNWNHNDWNSDWNDDNQDEDEADADSDTWSDQLLTEENNAAIQNAVLDLDAVAGEFSITPTDAYLLKFEREGNVGKYSLDAENAGSSVVLKLSMNGRKIRSGNIKNDATISLNPAIIWDLKVDAGAAKIDFDLSPFKIDRIDVDGGASSLNLKIGDLYDKTDIRINTGASAIKIEVPESAGCELHTSTVLSSKSFEGFVKIDNGYYQTEGYSTAIKKITIKIDAAVSEVRVERY